jgi:hypothetical protein
VSPWGGRTSEGYMGSSPEFYAHGRAAMERLDAHESVECRGAPKRTQALPSLTPRSHAPLNLS